MKQHPVPAHGTLRNRSSSALQNHASEFTHSKVDGESRQIARKSEVIVRPSD